MISKYLFDYCVIYVVTSYSESYTVVLIICCHCEYLLLDIQNPPLSQSINARKSVIIAIYFSAAFQIGIRQDNYTQWFLNYLRLWIPKCYQISSRKTDRFHTHVCHMLCRGNRQFPGFYFNWGWNLVLSLYSWTEATIIGIAP